MILLDGRPVRDAILADLRARVDRLGRSPVLVLVARADQVDSVYVRNKLRAATSIGVRIDIAPPKDIARLNADPKVDAILVQMPLGEKLPEPVNPRNDADGCTPSGIVELLKYYGIPITGKRAVVVGRNAFMGRPIAMRLLDQDATVTICHSQTRDLAAECRRAEILVTATARPGLIQHGCIAPGAVVVDVGSALVDGKYVGDVAPGAADVASAYAPVPGGVGPMTVAMLLLKTVELAEANPCCA